MIIKNNNRTDFSCDEENIKYKFQTNIKNEEIEMEITIPAINLILCSISRNYLLYANCSINSNQLTLSQQNWILIFVRGHRRVDIVFRVAPGSIPTGCKVMNRYQAWG